MSVRVISMQAWQIAQMKAVTIKQEKWQTC